MDSILRQKPPGVLTGLAIIVSGVVFVPVYILAIASTCVPPSLMPSGMTDILAALLSVPFYWANMVFFSSTTIYLLTSIASFALGVVALIWGRPGRLARMASLAMMSLVITFPLVCRYAPPVSAAPGYTMYVVTQPGVLEGIVKMSQVTTEKRPCEYRLLGWDGKSRFYYQATCGTQVQFWRYGMTPALRNEQVSEVPADLAQRALSKQAVLEMVRADSVRPAKYESATRPLYVRSEGYVSPNGRWTAVVTRHIYGPEDIVILAPSE
jgi:hypothetical protein